MRPVAVTPPPLFDALSEVDVLYLTDAEASEFGPLRTGLVFREGGLSEEETRRAWEIVAAYRKRFSEDVRTIGPTLTREEIEYLSRTDPDRFTRDEWRRSLVAFELAIGRGGVGVKPKNVARVLFPDVKGRSAGQRSRPQARATRSRRLVRRSRSRSPGRRSSAGDGDPHEHDLTPRAEAVS